MCKVLLQLNTCKPLAAGMCFCSFLMHSALFYTANLLMQFLLDNQVKFCLSAESLEGALCKGPECFSFKLSKVPQELEMISVL